MYCALSCCLLFFFFKQKTAYELRISDWSSDVCSSDLVADSWGRVDFDKSLFSICARAAINGSLRSSGWIVRKLIVPPTDPSIVCAEIGRESCRERVCTYV